MPIDVLWFRISRQANDPENLLGNINYGRALILINRGDYFQAGLIIRKGAFEEVKRRGIEQFQRDLAANAPYLGERVKEIKDWEQVKLLTVQINRLCRWYERGLLIIGDAAHAMSPVGGVGINLAIQDSIATANLLGDALIEGRVSEELLERVQRRRNYPAQATQFLQKQAHKQMDKLFQNPGPLHAPWQFKAVVNIPGLQRVMGRLVGLGVRPEHVAGVARTGAGRWWKPAVAAAVAIGVGLAMRRVARRAI